MEPNLLPNASPDNTGSQHWATNSTGKQLGPAWATSSTGKQLLLALGHKLHRKTACNSIKPPAPPENSLHQHWATSTKTANEQHLRDNCS